jgi:DNA ligase-1
LLDPLVVTGISNSKLSKALKPVKQSLFSTQEDLFKPNDLFELLDYLQENNTGRDTDIRICQNFLAEYSDNLELYDFIASIITKSLKLSVDYKVVNSVYGKNFIYVHEVQKAMSIKDTKLQPGEWICISQKLNGNRGTYENGKVISRQGKEFTGIDHIIKELNLLRSLYPVNMVFDGEIMRKNIDNLPDKENFTIGTGILNSDEEDKSCLEFIILDVLPQSEFHNGESSRTYKQRLLDMYQIQQALQSNSSFNNIRLVNFLYEGTDHSKIDYWTQKMTEQGFEGCMVARDVPYFCKRHNGLLKSKIFNNMDLEIIGYEVGEGKYAGMLGAFIVQYKDNTVKVGSGLTDEQRQEFWDIKEDLIGRVIEVKYKEITSDKTTGKESLQFPIFQRLREIGKEVSIY